MAKKLALRSIMRQKGYTTPRGLDIDRLAREAGLKYPTLRNIVSEGRITINLESAIKIATALQVPVEDLIVEDEHETPESETPARQLQAV